MPVSDLRSHIGFWLRFVSNHVSHSFAAKLAATGVTVAEWVILRDIYGTGGPTSPGEVAERTGLTRGAVSKLADRLFHKKLLTRAVSNKDRRYQEVRLTPAARALVPKLAALADRNDAEYFSPLTRDERRGLLRLLQKLVRAHNLTRVPID